jgi:hypothetical protein
MNEVQKARVSSWLILFLIYYFCLAQPAHAYFDLGMGAFMIQMVLGFVAAIWLSMRTTWIRVGRKIQKKDGQTPAENSGSASAEATETTGSET